jgi:hypothetical protein
LQKTDQRLAFLRVDNEPGIEPWMLASFAVAVAVCPRLFTVLHRSGKSTSQFVNGLNIPFDFPASAIDE